MRVIIAGGSGFIGRRLCEHLVHKGFEVAILSRRPAAAAPRLPRGVSALSWDGKSGDGWAQVLAGDCALVNLAGENIAQGRWTPEKKRRIEESRLLAGEAVVDAVRRAKVPPKALIQASAVGYYGPRGPQRLDEDARQGQGFLAELCGRWELSTLPVEALGVRRCVVRTGVVLGPGGALTRMLPPFRLFLGGPLGDGRQGVSWIHLDDHVRAITFLLEQQDAAGPYNLTAPSPVPGRDLAKALGAALGRPSWLPVPAFVLRAVLGEMAQEALLSGQFVVPRRLLDAGFVFRHPDILPALQDILANPGGRP